MSKKIPCGGFTFNEDEFEFLNGELNLKQGAGGEATKAHAYDLFPRTHHVECVVLMSKVDK
jgi:hypothetical protein